MRKTLGSLILKKKLKNKYLVIVHKDYRKNSKKEKKVKINLQNKLIITTQLI
jgi:hypothetical protein